MKKQILYLFALLLFSCSNKIAEQDLQLLNGYWEISEVVFPNGASKPYGVNTTIDYIEIKDSVGFLKKMKPGLNGRYTTNNSTLYFNASFHKEAWILNFNEGASQQLRITEIDSNSYSAQNELNITYLYKRYVPININNE